VNTTYVKSEDEVLYNIRYCKGKFTNTTWPEMEGNGKMDTVQICKGKTYLYMKDMKKCKETGEWMKEFFYSKSCFSKYFLVVKRLETTLVGIDKYKVATYCEAAAETMKFEKEKEGCGPGKQYSMRPHFLFNMFLDKKGCVDVPTTCNCEKTSIDEPCEGRFKIVMDKKPSSNYGRRLSEANGDSEESMKKKWTFICDGKWIPYGGAFYECEGIKQEYKEMDYYNYHSSKNCTGTYGASMFKEISGGFTMCNGKSSFEEIMSIPVVAPPT